EEENPPSYTEYHYGPPTVGPDGYYVPGFVYRCEDGWRIGPFDLGGETPGYENNCFFGFCGDPADLIHDVQGSGFVSPVEGSVVVLEGVVVGDFQGSDQLSGFFLQEESADYDALETTSEGIFVYDSTFGTDVVVGDVVRVQGVVDEYYDWTELTSISNLLVCGSGATPAPEPVNLPVASFGELEQVENMLVTFPQSLTATESYTLGRYGEVALSANGRLFNPTQVVEPGQPAIDYQAANNLNRIQLEDGSRIQNPATVPYLAPDGTLRLGDTVTDLTGVISYSFDFYELQPTQPVTFTRVNERQPAPDDVGGRVTVASFNVLNYFTTIDDGAWICGPEFDQECRGADSEFEFERQRTKIIEAMVAMNADVIGVIEIENNTSASLADLVQGLNDVLGEGTYAYVDTGTIGGDAIKVGFIYKPATVSLVGDFAILDSSVDARFNDERNRPALAQTFMENLSGEMFTAVVNHLKSKGSPCDDIGDPDTGDGQGNCNLTRLAAAEAMTDWLATDPTGSGDPDFLIMGDLNSYAMEDPIDAIQAAGYTNLIAEYNGYEEYSYVFDGQFGTLDHALSNPTLTDQVTGVTVWHINSDEPIILDYNTEYNPPELYQANAYRSSDHDPVVIGLNLIPQCQGANATVYVDLNGIIVGGAWDGRTFRHNLRGTPGDDVIAGTDDHEVLDGLQGNDFICGYGGNDVLFGREGNDVLDGGDGNDVIMGWFGDDVLIGGLGADILHGFFGTDELHAGPGEDFLHGGHGYDLCDGGSDTDHAVQCEVKEDIP
ncbi:MAG: ExeM/NucH family extracellular endonuclease, partial [Anaerolineales bacterium]